MSMQSRDSMLFNIQSKKAKKWAKIQPSGDYERRFFGQESKSLAPRRAHGLASYRQNFGCIAELEVENGTEKRA